MDLDGQVAIITGATRGIGKAIALRLADHGVKVVVTGKTTEPGGDLPGTIYTTAEEIEENGGEALPLKLNVRDEDEVKSVIDQTVDEWGRLDILINNAGAIQLTSVEETPPNRFDLLMEVNARGAYCCSHYAIPHMRDTGGGHILMASPPVASDSSPGKTAYGLSKIGMTYIAKSLAKELHDDNIAANAFWPLTAIDTRATRYFNLGTEEMWRKPAILCDMVEEIVQTDPSELSGEALLAEPFLRERGYDDFEQYNVVEGSDPPPLSAQMFDVDV
jgi:citronellol/citronellal dehydrogenase